MKWYKVFNSNVPQVKRDPLSAFMIGSSIINGIGSMVSQHDANRANIALSRESREWQSEENQKNRDWQEMMWNQQNEYNSPANQRLLAEEAGYNPYLLGEKSLGSSAGDVGSPSMVGAPQTAHVNPVNPMPAMTDTLSQMLPIINQRDQVQSNVDFQKAKQIQTMAQTAIDAYDKLGYKGYKEVMDTLSPVLAQINLQDSRSDVMFNEIIKNYLSERYNRDMDSLNKELQYELGKQYSPTQIETSIAESNARITDILTRLDLSKQLTEQEIKTSVATMVKEYAAAWNLRKQGDLFVADAKTVNALRDGLKNQLNANVNRLLIQNGFLARDYQSGTSTFNWLTSQEGQDRLRQSASQVIEWNGSQMGFVLDKIFGNYVKIAGSANYNYGVSQSSSSSESHSVVEVYK